MTTPPCGHRRPGLRGGQPRGLRPAPGPAGLLADQGGTGHARRPPPSIPTPCRRPGAGGRRRAAWQAAGYPYEHARSAGREPRPPGPAAPRWPSWTPWGPRRSLGWSGPGCAGRCRATFPVGRSAPPGKTRPGSRPAGPGRCFSSARDARTPRSADRLVISTRTVDSHVAAVLAKLGVATRRAAAALPGGRPGGSRPESSVAADADLGSRHGIREGPPRRTTAWSTRARCRKPAFSLGRAGRRGAGPSVVPQEAEAMPETTDPTFYPESR